MYHSVTGKRLVAAVNCRDGTNYSVRQFFDGVFIPLMFANERFLLNVGNSPFFQDFTVRKIPFTPSARNDCLRRVHEKVHGKDPDGSIFLGGPATGNTETTSGQVTSMRLPIDEDDVLASWIGAAAGMTVDGGLTLLVDAEDVLLSIYDGWTTYRRFVDQTPRVKALQVNTWNGQWVAGKLSGARDMQPIANRDGDALAPQKWVRLLFALSTHYRGSPVRNLLAYVYAFGKSNKTIGFVRLGLTDAQRLVGLYHQLFTVPSGMPPKAFETLYQTEKSFMAACAFTEIGLRALRPEDVFGAQKGLPKVPTKTEAEKSLAFDTYQTWIIAMLNSRELMTKAEDLAKSLFEFQNQSERAKTDRGQTIENLLKRKNKREFIDGLADILETAPGNVELFERAVGEITSLSHDDFGLFLTLVGFKYAAARAKRQGGN